MPLRNGRRRWTSSIESCKLGEGASSIGIKKRSSSRSSTVGCGDGEGGVGNEAVEVTTAMRRKKVVNMVIVILYVDKFVGSGRRE